MATVGGPNLQSSRKTIGNLDGTSAGIGGVDTIRVQAGTGNFYNTLTDTNPTVPNTFPTITMKNVGVGSGVYARSESDGYTFDFRSLLAGEGMGITIQGDSILFTSTGTGVDHFTGLKDVPQAYTGSNGKTLVVDEANNRLVFASFPTPITNFLALTDSPDTYQGAEGQYVTVHNNALVFSTLPPYPTIPDFPENFIELNDAPSSYAGANGQYVVVSGNKLVFQALPQFVTSFLGLTDTPKSYTGADGEYLRVNASTGKIEFAPINIPEAGNKITYAENPPSNANEGDGWWDITDGSFYLYYTDGDSGQWVESGGSEPATGNMDPAPYDYGAFFDGAPLSGQIVYRWRAPRAHSLAANFQGCLFTAGTAPTNDFVCPIFINGAQAGTWTLAAGTGAATLVSNVSGTISIAANIEIKIVAPTQTDGTVADLVVSFKGERTE